MYQLRISNWYMFTRDHFNKYIWRFWGPKQWFSLWSLESCNFATTCRFIKNWISRRMYSSSPVRHAGLFWCLTSADRSPVAVLSDTLCLTFFKPEFLRSLIWEFCSVTFAKTFEKWIDHHVWQMSRKLFLNYNLYHIVLSDICQTGQK